MILNIQFNFGDIADVCQTVEISNPENLTSTQVVNKFESGDFLTSISFSSSKRLPEVFDISGGKFEKIGQVVTQSISHDLSYTDFSLDRE